jgi:CIC family chloride channel protein
MLGGAFGSLDRTLFNHPDSTLGAFALVGMGAVFSATIRAPMTSVLIIIEMTAGYDLIVPLMIANMSAYVIARRYRPLTIYEALLEQDGIHLRDRAVLDALQELTLEGLLERNASFLSVPHAARARDVLRVVTGSVGAQVDFPVIGE